MQAYSNRSMKAPWTLLSVSLFALCASQASAAPAHSTSTAVTRGPATETRVVAGVQFLSVAGEDPALELGLMVQTPPGPQPKPAPKFTSSGAGGADQCSAKDSTTTCSVDKSSSGASCSATGGNAHCSSQNGTGSGGNFCSSDQGGNQQCSVISGEDSACSSRQAGNTCSAKGSATAGAQCSVYGSGGKNGGAGVYCTSFYKTGGTAEASCSAQGAGSKCSVKAGTKYTMCTSKDYTESVAAPKCSALDSLGTCSVISFTAAAFEAEAAGTQCYGDEEFPPTIFTPPTDSSSSVVREERDSVQVGAVVHATSCVPVRF